MIVTKERHLVTIVLGAAWVLGGCGGETDSSVFRASAGDGGSNRDGSGGGDFFTFDGSLADGARSLDAGGDGNCGPNLTGIVRDFQDTHPDFEKTIGDDRGLVQIGLGSDDKPVFAKTGATKTVSGKASFDQWYRAAPGVNQEIPFRLDLVRGANGVFTYSNTAFFPIDGQGWGNQNRNHNFHFTYELHTEFVYLGGEVFSFTGDDDLFVFVNGRLAIDLGGVHSAETQVLNLDQSGAALGITKGNTYPLAIFQAERHTTESNFRIDTTIQFTNCAPIIR